MHIDTEYSLERNCTLLAEVESSPDIYFSIVGSCFM